MTPSRARVGSVHGVRPGHRSRIEHYALTGLAAALALGTLIEDLVRPDVTVTGRQYDRAPELALVVFLVVAVALLALRRRIGILGPIGALVALGVATLPAPALALNTSFVFLFAMLVCGMAGYATADRRGALGLVVILAVAASAEARNPHHTPGNGLLVAAFMTIAWGTGLLVRRPVSQARSAEQRALQLQQEHEEAARQAVAEEQRRIARELHDIIAHSVSVMTMQAGAVRRLLLPEQQREREVLLSVEQTGRDAMSEMRRLVGLLKAGEAAAYSPQPGMRSLNTLIATVREAGLPVEVEYEGEQQDLPPGVDLTAFRVVQESLTNAIKHAEPSRAWVRIRWTQDGVGIEVGNDGPSRPDGPDTGFGHAGMRERLGLYGGELESGPGADGGYVVRAYLPVRTAT
jgi:signal transduction histidine kinase